MLKTRSFPDLYPLIRPPRRPLTLGRGRIFIQGSVRSPPKLAVYDVAYSLPLVILVRDSPFTEEKTWKHFSYLSGTFREYVDILILYWKWWKSLYDWKYIKWNIEYVIETEVCVCASRIHLSLIYVAGNQSCQFGQLKRLPTVHVKLGASSPPISQHASCQTPLRSQSYFYVCFISNRLRN